MYFCCREVGQQTKDFEHKIDFTRKNYCGGNKVEIRAQGRKRNNVKFQLLNKNWWTSLVAQWLRICLTMQGTQVQALAWEDPTCRGATKPCVPQLLSLRATTTEACEPQLLSPSATTTEACAPRAHAPQQEKPLQ